MVRALDSWSKGRGFESLQEWRENFLLQGRLSVLTLISVSVPPRVTAVARKRSRSVCQKCRWQLGQLQLNTHTPYVCGFARSDMVHGCMVYTELAPCQRCKYSTSVDIKKQTKKQTTKKPKNKRAMKTSHSCRTT